MRAVQNPVQSVVALENALFLRRWISLSAVASDTTLGLQDSVAGVCPGAPGSDPEKR